MRTLTSLSYVMQKKFKDEITSKTESESISQIQQ